MSSIDSDLRLLLTSCTPLLSNRNSAVVLQVATLFFYLAPKSEFSKVGKPLVALLGTYPEVQYVVLSNISTLAAQRPVISPLYFFLFPLLFAAQTLKFNSFFFFSERLWAVFEEVLRSLDGSLLPQSAKTWDLDQDCDWGQHLPDFEGVPVIRQELGQEVCDRDHPSHWPLCSSPAKCRWFMSSRPHGSHFQQEW